MNAPSSTPTLSAAAIQWLQAVLRERVSAALVLDHAPGASLTLRVPQADGVIVFDQLVADFAGRSTDMPCGTWDPSSEGWTSVLGSALPAPGQARFDGPVIESSPGRIAIHYDILGLAYWMLTRAEEVGRQDLDAHGRFSAKSSHAWRHGYLSRPIVDEWFHILRQAMQRLWPQLALQQHEFALRLSHDVDFPSQYAFRTTRSFVRQIAEDVVRRRRFGDAMRGPWIRMSSRSRLMAQDPANTFDWLMQISETHAVQSAFYFICGRTAPQFDAGYEPEDAAIVALMKDIHHRGHEIGLHPSYSTYQTPSAIATEAKRLREVCASNGIRQTSWGGRMHFLRWKTPTTFLGWEQAGMSYDSTLGYADCAGFRCGTAHEYPAFDPVADRALNLRVRPLIAMECTVMAAQYMGQGTGERAHATLTSLKSTCHAVGGQFTLLWHNSELGSPVLRDLYESVVAHRPAAANGGTRALTP